MVFHFCQIILDQYIRLNIIICLIMVSYCEGQVGKDTNLMCLGFIKGSVFVEQLSIIIIKQGRCI